MAIMPMKKEDVMVASTALNKSLEEKNVQVSLDILKQLRDELVATDVLLRETRMGLTIGKLRKHPERRIADISAEIVRKWKQDVDEAKARAGKLQGKPQSNPSNASSNGTTTTAGNSELVQKSKTPRTAETDGVKTAITEDATRNNCIKLAYNSLSIDAEETIDKEVILKCATAIESITFRIFNRKIENPYKQKMRSLCLNLKGQNISLRKDVVSGDLSPEEFCKMTPEDMASDERKAMNKKLQEDSIFKAMAATNTNASTDAFKCSKCGKNQTTYYQLQVSAIFNLAYRMTAC